MNLFSRLRRRRENSEASPSSEPLVIVSVPALITQLLLFEKKKGAPLSEEEVLSLRDSALSMALPASEARRMAEARGYRDLDPKNIWNEWQEYLQGKDQAV